MTLRSEIRAALEKEPKGALMDDLFEACESADDEGKFRANISVLKAEGKVKIVGTTDEEKPKALYGIANWPEKGETKTTRRKAAPPPRTTRSGKKNRKTRRTRTAIAIADSVPPAAPNGAAFFAINDTGRLAVTKGEAAVVLEPAEFERLRSFIERTDSIWNLSQE